LARSWHGEWCLCRPHPCTYAYSGPVYLSLEADQVEADFLASLWSHSSQQYLIPGGRVLPSGLMLWWCLLRALSHLARYEPAAGPPPSVSIDPVSPSHLKQQWRRRLCCCPVCFFRPRRASRRKGRAEGRSGSQGPPRCTQRFNSTQLCRLRCARWARVCEFARKGARGPL
jgi:hypothetical protein